MSTRTWQNHPAGADGGVGMKTSNAVSLPTPDSPLRLRTKLAFATVTALGGMVAGSGHGSSTLPYLLVLFCVVGFLLVDWLKLFALPSVVAYAAMMLAAVYCVSDFLQQGLGIDRKVVAVSDLLIIAQSILMLQSKNQRLFEQLMVFAVLHCIVAAVFNDAFSYAVWLLPLACVSGVALVLLAADTTFEQTRLAMQPDADSANSAVADSAATRAETSSNAVALESLAHAGIRLPWLALLVLFPAVVAFALLFFFGLPRTVSAKRGLSAGQAVVGFSETVRLEQIGRMLQSDRRALRVSLTDSINQRPYPVRNSVYLRGKALEVYRLVEDYSSSASDWRSYTAERRTPQRPLLPRLESDSPLDQEQTDRVKVEVQTESSRDSALFAIAPFYWMPGSSEILQEAGSWTLIRQQSETEGLGSAHPPMEYSFGTVAFRNGIQSDWIPYRPLAQPSNEQRSEQRSLAETEPPPQRTWTAEDLDYLDALLEFPAERLPSVSRLATKLIERLPENQRDSYTVATQFERHLSLAPNFEYTLDLNAKPQPGVDPIEQFVATDRKGHCQYFASALAMMLRSQDIPARVVVGYRADEFNPLGQYFTVRQNQAHAWVEALIERQNIPPDQMATMAGQPNASQYWLRLDPTPGGGGVEEPVATSQMFDLAQHLWDDYVVEMDPVRQRESLLTAPGVSPMAESYRNWIDRLREITLKTKEGRVEGFGSGLAFSLPAAFVTIGCGLLLLLVLRSRWPGWWRRRSAESDPQSGARPSVAFYAEAMDLLNQLGLRRRSGQTAMEFAGRVGGRDAELDSPLHWLTNAFYRERYAGGRSAPDQSEPNDHPGQSSRWTHATALQQLRQIVASRVDADGLPTAKPNDDTGTSKT